MGAHARYMVIIGLLLASTVGCTRPNAQYCEQLSDCQVGWSCDAVARECIFNGLDAGYDGPGCADSPSCPETAPICSADHACEACDPGADGAAACAARDSARPLCRADGRCAECLSAIDCTGDVTRAFCDADRGTCRGCTSHDECTSEVCNRSIGTCAETAGIIYVDNDGGADGAGCGSQVSPCLTIAGSAGALRQLDAVRRTIRVRAGIQAYAESLDLDGLALVIVGAGASLRPVVSDTAAIVVHNGANVTIDGLRIEGASGNADADGVRCEGTGSILRLSAVTVTENDDLGVDISDPCELRLSRSVVSGNLNGGVRVRSDAFELVNNFIINNGGAIAAVGGAHFAQTGTTSTRRFDYNTVAGNESAAANGVTCDSALTGTGNIVWGNATGTQASANCSWTYSDIGGGAAGTGNIDVDPMFVASDDVHLMPGSPCIDAADPTATLAIDIDGDTRPRGAGVDIGADEAGN
ncbi:MAG TPA: right-handed parallel beta-helix repeat-containing protein [Kofleriaceae bacterium]|nr:right-handed parallel beta-helix repeat-containing protein [Kofleriaceae bacterium]